MASPLDAALWVAAFLLWSLVCFAFGYFLGRYPVEWIVDLIREFRAR